MVGDPDVLPSEPKRLLNHGFGRFLSIRVGCVHVSLTNYFRNFNQFWQFAFLRRLNLSGILSELGRDKRQSQKPVKFLFGPDRQWLADFLTAGKLRNTILGEG